MARLNLFLLVADSECRDWLERAFSSDPDLTVVGISSSMESYARSRSYVPEVGVFVVDLDCSRDSPVRFWVSQHVLYPGARILAVTGPSTEVATAQAALHARVNAFIPRGSSEAQLCDVVWAVHEDRVSVGYLPILDAARALFARPEERFEELLQLAREMRRVALSSHHFTLSSLEFSVLAYHAGRVVSNGELLEKVWQCSVGRGEAALPPKLAARLLDESARLANRPDAASSQPNSPDLTRREREVLNLIATDATDKEIAGQLSLSLHTVKTHVRSILSKLHAVNRRQAAKLAAQSGTVKR